MTKSELASRLADKAQLSDRESETIVNMMLDCIAKALQEGDKVELRGFGSFRTRSRDARIGRNPKTGEAVEVPPRRTPYFRAAKALKEKLGPPESL